MVFSWSDPWSSSAMADREILWIRQTPIWTYLLQVLRVWPSVRWSSSPSMNFSSSASPSRNSDESDFARRPRSTAKYSRSWLPFLFSKLKPDARWTLPLWYFRFLARSRTHPTSWSVFRAVSRHFPMAKLLRNVSSQREDLWISNPRCFCLLCRCRTWIPRFQCCRASDDRPLVRHCPVCRRPSSSFSRAFWRETASTWRHFCSSNLSWALNPCRWSYARVTLICYVDFQSCPWFWRWCCAVASSLA